MVTNIDQYQSDMRTVRDYLESQLVKVFGADKIHFNGKLPGSERIPNTCNVSILGENLKGKVDYLFVSVKHK